MTFILRIAVFLAVLAAPLSAEPVAYRLDTAKSRVQYRVPFGTGEIFGTMPIQSADITLDFDAPRNSRVAVVLNADGATANFLFAADALKSPSVLNTAEFPTVAFRTTSFRARGNEAALDGDITIRGVTRPVTLAGGLFRERGQAAGDRSELLVRMRGVVDRTDFGADGWADLVDNEVSLDILVRILRVE